MNCQYSNGHQSCVRMRRRTMPPHHEHLRQLTFRWNTIHWSGRFSSSGACCQWSRRMAFPRSICQIFTAVEKNASVNAHNVHPQRGEDSSRKRRSYHMISDISQLADAIDFLFPPHILADSIACLERSFLSPHNVFVDEFNDFVLNALPRRYCPIHT
jgi:hypothetical protein